MNISELDIFKRDKTVYHIDKVQYFKEEQEGIKQMTSYFEELRAEGRAQGMAQGIADTLRVLGISREEYERKLAEQQAVQITD